VRTAHQQVRRALNQKNVKRRTGIAVIVVVAMVIELGDVRGRRISRP
jgi:hypothetical protein